MAVEADVDLHFYVDVNVRLSLLNQWLRRICRHFSPLFKCHPGKLFKFSLISYLPGTHNSKSICVRLVRFYLSLHYEMIYYTATK